MSIGILLSSIGSLCARLTVTLAILQDYEPPSGEIAKQIEKDFGSLDKLIPVFNAKTAAIQVRISLPQDIPS